MTTINMTATISDLIEFSGEWTPETGYHGAEDFEHLKKCSEASAKADAEFHDDWKFLVELEKQYFAFLLTDEEEEFYKDFRRDLIGKSEEDYMPYGMTYIPVEDRI